MGARNRSDRQSKVPPPEGAVDGKAAKRFSAALRDFMCMAKGRSQNGVLRYFLQEIITLSDVCDHGSVLLYNPEPAEPDGEAGSLRLFEKVASNINGQARFPPNDVRMKIDKGIAGLVFRKRAAQYVEDAPSYPEFLKLPDQDIGPIYCVPIMLPNYDQPYGIVSFHNPRRREDRMMGEEDFERMGAAVNALEAMLTLAPIPLVDRERIFIVHGRDKEMLGELQAILDAAGIDYVVIQSLARTGQDLLTFIEERIRGCIAGFVLLTPDDEGRLVKAAEPLRARARQNVIFEGGYLTALFRRTNRVCFMRQGDLEIPSDLNGLLMETSTDRLDPDRIRLTLREWGLTPKEVDADGESPSDSRPAGSPKKSR